MKGVVVLCILSLAALGVSARDLRAAQTALEELEGEFKQRQLDFATMPFEPKTGRFWLHTLSDFADDLSSSPNWTQTRLYYPPDWTSDKGTRIEQRASNWYYVTPNPSGYQTVTDPRPTPVVKPTLDLQAYLRFLNSFNQKHGQRCDYEKELPALNLARTIRRLQEQELPQSRVQEINGQITLLAQYKHCDLSDANLLCQPDNTCGRDD